MLITTSNLTLDDKPNTVASRRIIGEKPSLLISNRSLSICNLF